MSLEKILQKTRFVTGYSIRFFNLLTIAIIHLNNLAKSRSFKIVVLAISLLVGLAIFIPMTLNNSALKFKIEQKISEISKSNFSINGELEIKFIPYPVIIANNVVMRNFSKKNEAGETIGYFNFYAKSIISQIPLFGISSDSFTSNLTFNDAILESYQSDIWQKNEDSYFLKAITEDKIPLQDIKNSDMGQGISGRIFNIERISSDQFNILNIPKIKISNGKFIRYDNMLRKKKMEAINGYIDLDYSKLKTEIDFNSNKFKSKIKALINFGSKKSYIEILSPIIVARMDGRFNKNNNIAKSQFSGNLIADISELKSFYGSYVNNYDLIFNKLNYNSKDIKISADINNVSKELTIDNILINSSIINGEGVANISLSQQIPIIDIALNLKHLDLDSLWSGEPLSLEKIQSYIKYFPDQKQEQEITRKTQELSKDSLINKKEIPEAGEESELIIIDNKSVYDDADQPLLGSKQKEIIENEKLDIQSISKNIKYIDLTAEIKIDNVKYLDGEIKNSDIYITISKGGKVMILPLIFETPGGGMFRVSGAFDNNSKSPKFVGKIDAKGDNLQDILRWFNIESQNLKMDNLKKYSIYSDILLLPSNTIFNNIYLNLNNNSNEFLGNIKIVSNRSKSNDVILDLYGTHFNVDEFFLTSGQNIYLSPGSFLKKILWLNSMISRNDIKLRFDSLVYKGETFRDQSLRVKIGRGYFEISDMKLVSDKTNLEANLILDVSGNTPKFNARVFADKFSYDSQDNNIELNSSFKTNNNLEHRDFFDQILALPSLKGFDGIINLYLKKVTIDGFEMDEAKIYGELSDGSLKNSEVTSDLLGGSLEYKGLVRLGNLKVLSGSLTATDIDIGKILNKIANINNIEARGNISAGFSSSAAKKEDFFRNLSSKIAFNAKSVQIYKYGLSNLIKELFVASIQGKRIGNPEAIIFDNNSKTVFDQVTGTINIIDNQRASFRADIKAPALNSILSGSLNIKNKLAKGNFNTLFLTGTRKKQIPINISSNISYKDGQLTQITNLDQVRQYLGLPTLYSKKIVKEEGVNNAQESIDFSKDFNNQNEGSGSNINYQN